MKKILLVLCLLLCSCTSKPKYSLYVYYADGCRVCDSLMKLVVNDLKDEYGKDMEIIKMNIDKEESIEAYAKTCTMLENYELNEQSGEVPFLVLDGYFALSGFDILQSELVKDAISDAISGKELPEELENVYYFKEGKTYN